MNTKKLNTAYQFIDRNSSTAQYLSYNNKFYDVWQDIIIEEWKPLETSKEIDMFTLIPLLTLLLAY